MNARRAIQIGIGIAFLVVLGLFMVTYKVEFSERAVLTTFGEARSGEAKGPGLHFKLPPPFQSVTKYDTRVQFVATRAETQQTADNRQVIVEAFALWRVSDPLLFFRTFSNAGDRAEEHFREAENRLRDILRSTLSVTGRFGLSDLFPVGDAPSRMGELETLMLASIRRSSVGDAGNLGEYGIEVVQAGVSRVLLPQETSKAVIERMRENRNRLVRQIESAGQAEADTIRRRAEEAKRRIIAFAEARASELKARGDIEAAEFIALLDEAPELAVYMKQLDLLRNSAARRTTLILPSSAMGLEATDPTNMRGGGLGVSQSLIRKLNGGSGELSLGPAQRAPGASGGDGRAAEAAEREQEASDGR